MLSLDPDDARPPYAQVVHSLRQQIEEGILAAGAKLPTHDQLRVHYGVSVGTVKRALNELQGAGLIVSRQGQGTFVRTRRSLIEGVPPSFSAETLAGLWVTAYGFEADGRRGWHADITRISAQSARRVVAKNFPPEPRTDGYAPAFRNDIEAQLAGRHVIGFWKNVSDTRFFGALHLAVLPGETRMQGYYTALSTDVLVDAEAWYWVRLDSAGFSGIDLGRVRIRDAQQVYALLQEPSVEPIALEAIAERPT